MKINLIWASDLSNAIGYKNQLLFKSKKDLSNFKHLTSGKGNNAVVMGRKTYESIGSKPLQGRLNIILTRNKEYSVDPRCIKVHSLDEVLRLCSNMKINELWVIGGKEIYELFLPISNTLVHTSFSTKALLVENEVWTSVLLIGRNNSYISFPPITHNSLIFILEHRRNTYGEFYASYSIWCYLVSAL